MISMLFILLTVLPLFHCSVVDKALNQGAQVLNEAKTDRKVRECNCQEQKECVDEMKEQVQQCFDGCWSKVKMVTSNTNELKQCYQGKEYIIEKMLTCVQNRINSCTNGGEEQIQYTDINKLIEKGDDQIQKSAQLFMNTLTSGKNLIETAVEVGGCTGCQPLIEPKDAQKEIKKCMQHIGWKKEAADLCQCSEKAGVKNIGDFCKLLSTMTHPAQGRH